MIQFACERISISQSFLLFISFEMLVGAARNDVTSNIIGYY